MSTPPRIGILAGGGSLPREIAQSIAARGIPLHIVAIDGEADADFDPYPVTRVNWGEIGRIVKTFKDTGVTDLVIIGSVKRPDLGAIKPDAGFFKALATVLGLVLAGGDDKVLRGVIAFFERSGFRVVGPAQIAPELVIPPGNYTHVPVSEALLADAQRGFDVIALLGRFDIGQAAVVADGRIEAIEAAEGTDQMLARLAGMRRDAGLLPGAARGVLVKRTKPTQDDRIDLPAIGPATVMRAMEAGLAGVAVEAGRALLASRAEMLERAQAGGLVIVGAEIDRSSAAHAGARAARGRTLSGKGLAYLKARRNAAALAVTPLGAVSVPARVMRDAGVGLDVMGELSSFGGSRAVVVVRRHVLAVEMGEGVAAAMLRAAGLRQWGDRRLRRRAGVVVINAGRDCDGELIEIAERAGIAGLLVRLRRFTAGVPQEMIAAADKAGVFVAGIAADGEAGHV